jgi:hypothetical protein
MVDEQTHRATMLNTICGDLESILDDPTGHYQIIIAVEEVVRERFPRFLAAAPEPD